jgi:hypothetical protein
LANQPVVRRQRPNELLMGRTPHMRFQCVRCGLGLVQENAPTLTTHGYSKCGLLPRRLATQRRMTKIHDSLVAGCNVRLSVDSNDPVTELPRKLHHQDDWCANHPAIHQQ